MNSPLFGDWYREALKRMHSHQEALASVEPEATVELIANCVDCGTWNGCVCKKPETMPVHCYVCGDDLGKRRSGIVDVVVCVDCQRVYLEAGK